jgi:hypothetical protein
LKHFAAAIEGTISYFLSSTIAEKANKMADDALDKEKISRRSC